MTGVLILIFLELRKLNEPARDAESSEQVEREQFAADVADQRKRSAEATEKAYAKWKESGVITDDAASKNAKYLRRPGETEEERAKRLAE